MKTVTTSTSTSSSLTTTSTPRHSSIITVNSLITTDFEDFSTTGLPVLNLFPRNGRNFDYVVQIGANDDQVGLRLDIVQGDIWVPASSDFPECTVSSTFVRSTTIDQFTSFAVPTDPIETVMTVYTTYPESTATSTISVTSYVFNMVDSIYYQYCASLGVFDFFSSVTASFLDINNLIITNFQQATSYFQLYINSILVTGEWAMDSLSVSFKNETTTENIKFTGVPFVYSNFSNVGVGSLALGISQNTAHSYKYNFISNFVVNGLIKSNSYSLALSAFNYTSPELILGGVNPSYIYTPENGLNRFESPDDRTGLMALLDFVPVYDDTRTVVSANDGNTNTIPAIAMFSWGVTSASSGQSVTFASFYNDRMSTGNYPKAAVIDSRSFYNYIPYSTLISLAVELNAIYSEDSDRWVVDCSVGSTGSIDLNIGNYTVNMPINELLYPATFNNTNLVFTSGNAACYLAFLPDYKLGYSLLGTPFLKNVYMAVDNENNQLAISRLNNYVEESSDDSAFDSSLNSSDSKDVSSSSTMESESITRESNSTSAAFTEFDLQNGYSVLDGMDKTVEYVITSKVTRESTTYSTVITYSNLQEPTRSEDSTIGNFYAIESGTIPFARRYASVTGVTLSIPKTIVFTDTLQQSTQAVISDGEIIARTKNIVDDGATKGGRSATNTETQTNYGFSSLVTAITETRTKAAASHVKPPTIFGHHEASRSRNVIILAASLLLLPALFL